MGFFGSTAAAASLVQTPMRNAELVREIKLAGCPPARARFAPPPLFADSRLSGIEFVPKPKIGLSTVLVRAAQRQEGLWMHLQPRPLE